MIHQIVSADRTVPIPRSLSRIACFVLLVPTLILAQSESELKRFFEGKTVILKIDMPATSQGVEVYPLRQPSVNFEDYGKRLKKYGISLRSGESAIITKVKTKDKHIEFQLGGGGYGTFGDDMGNVPSTNVEKTEREKNLEQAIKQEKDATKKKALQEEHDELKKQRELEERRLRLEAEQQKKQNEMMVREKASQSGSRFNIRYDHELSAREMTPASVMAALDEVVDFPPEFLGGSGDTEPDVSDYPPGQPELRKGLLWEEVAVMFGAPQAVSERMEGSLKVMSCTFAKHSREIKMEFVEGVLIRYTISSN